MVESFNFFALGLGNPLEVNVFVAGDHFGTKEQLASLASDKIGQDPRFFLPLEHAASDQLSPLIRRPLFLGLCGGALRLENNIKQVGEQAARVFDIRVQECIEGEVVGIAELLEVLYELLADLVPVGCLLQVLLLQELQVDEVVLLLDQLDQPLKAQNDALNETRCVEITQRRNRNAELLQTRDDNFISFLHFP